MPTLSRLRLQHKGETLPPQFYKCFVPCGLHLKEALCALCWSGAAGDVDMNMNCLIVMFFHALLSSFESHFQSEDFMPDASENLYELALLSHL